MYLLQVYHHVLLFIVVVNLNQLLYYHHDLLHLHLHVHILLLQLVLVDIIIITCQHLLYQHHHPMKKTIDYADHKVHEQLVHVKQCKCNK